MQGYNDDLVMSFALTLWARDTALRLRNEGIELTKRTLSGVSSQMIPQKPTNQNKLLGNRSRTQWRKRIVRLVN